MALMISVVEWTQLRKQSASLKIGERKLLKLKREEKKECEKQNRVSMNCGTISKDITYV